MRSLARLDRFFFAEIDPAPLGLFRFLLGTLITVSFLALYPNWQSYFGPGGMRIEPANLAGWSLFAWMPDGLPFQTIWCFGLGSALAFALGWKTRWATLFLFTIQSSMNHTGLATVHGDDMVIRALLFYGIFAPLGDRYSIDSLVRARARARSSVSSSCEDARHRPAWPLRLMQINIALIYAFSLPLKLLSDSSWSNGEALYWVMMSTLWNRWPVQWLFYDGTLSKVLTYSTILVEGLFPILVWFQKTRLPILVAITAFHLGLAVFLQNLTFFSLAMVCSFALFIPGQKLASLDGKLPLPWRMK